MPLSENDLAEAAVSWLRERLPEDWEIIASHRGELIDAGADAVLEIRAPNAYSTLVVQAQAGFDPRDVERMYGRVGRTLRAFNPGLSMLVVAPWLSARTRELLATEGTNFVDLTGNARVRLDSPALFIETQGATSNPSPASRGKAGLRGARAGRLLRWLIDVRPPYGVRQLAGVSGLAPGYVSRLLSALDDDALIERSKRGQVLSADTRGLLRRWSETYDVFRTNDAQGFLAPPGARAARDMLPGGDPQTAVTGSFAASRIAPVAAPALLCVYCSDRDATARALDLMPADAGANVVLLRPFDPVVWERTSTEEGVTYVAPSQAAIDSLTGNGRMPAEGEALVDRMVADESTWRLESLTPAQ